MVWGLMALALAAAPGPQPVRYAALGDSFTAGTGGPPSQAFPARLVASWRAEGVAADLLNLGVNGYSTDDLLSEELGPLASFHPTLVTLAIGANDIVRGQTAEGYRANLRSILAAVVASGVPASRILVLPQPDWSRSPLASAMGDPVVYGAGIRAFNQILRDEALRAGARWVDLSGLMDEQARRGDLAPDHLHPSAAAYDAWARALGRLIAAEGLLPEPLR